MDEKEKNKESVIDFINKNKDKLPVSYLFLKDVKPTFVSYSYANSRKHNNIFLKVGVYHKLISISFLDEK